MVFAADLCLPPRQHLKRILRIDEAFQSLLPHRIEGDDRYAALGGVLQRMQHPRGVGSGVLAEDEHSVALLEILEQDRPYRRAERLRERDRCGFVAHVGTIGQLLWPYMRPNSGYSTPFRGCAARRVDHHRLWIEPLELRSDFREGLVPADTYLSLSAS